MTNIVNNSIFLCHGPVEACIKVGDDMETTILGSLFVGNIESMSFWDRLKLSLRIGKMVLFRMTAP